MAMLLRLSFAAGNTTLCSYCRKRLWETIMERWAETAPPE